MYQFQQPLEFFNPCQWCMGICGLLFCAGHPPVYHGMIHIQQNQPLPVIPHYQPPGPIQQNHYQHQASSSGPSWNQRRRFRQAEVRYANHNIHASSGTNEEDRSTGINPGHARINADDEAGGGKVWRTPVEESIDC